MESTMEHGKERMNLVPSVNANEALPMEGGADGSAPVLHPSAHAQELSGQAQRGHQLFDANCASCHGMRANGEGQAARSLLPKPANLTAARFADERLSAVLWNGVVGSSMPAWRDYSERDLRDLAAYVQELPRDRTNAVPLAPESFDQAKTLFLQNCASCHGDHGDGRGPAAAALAPAPTNFHLKQPSYDRATTVLARGVPGSAMPAWNEQLSVSDRALLANYIRGYFGTPQELPEAREQKVSDLKAAGK